MRIRVSSRKNRASFRKRCSAQKAALIPDYRVLAYLSCTLQLCADRKSNTCFLAAGFRPNQGFRWNEFSSAQLRLHARVVSTTVVRILAPLLYRLVVPSLFRRNLATLRIFRFETTMYDENAQKPKQDSLDWEEGPLECADHWEATRSSEGFDTIDMRRLQISPVQRDDKVPTPGVRQVNLLEGRGWGDGEHPSTWMCLEFLETAISGK